jgi:hypothetical protein
MFNIDSIAQQVKYNCNVSDARFWGYYSPCGILLRLRDLFRTENSLNVWENVQSRDITRWIGERETLWAKLSSCEFRPIEIQGKRFNLFNAREINNVLVKDGFFYGAGYGDFLKPTFLLAKISRHSEIGRHNVFILGNEIARDLSSSPAMLQGNTIIARMETLALFLWNKLEEMRARKYDDALSYAFSEYGIKKNQAYRYDPETLAVRIGEIAGDEIRSFIHHELGESSQRRLLGKWWKKLIIDLPYGRAERFLRDLKDVLADTCRGGMLDHIIREKRSGSLGFYCALLGGYRKIIFCDLKPAFDEFLHTRNWSFIERAKRSGYTRAKGYISRLKNCVDKGSGPGEIEKVLLNDIIPGISVNAPDPLY